MDLHGDPHLPLPSRAMWGAISKLFNQLFFKFKVFSFFVFFINSKTKQNQIFMYTNIVPVRIMGDPRDVAELAQRSVGREILQDLNLVKTLAKLKNHLEGLTLGILDMWIELPMQLQRHTISV